MHNYFLYSKTKEASNYVVKSLGDYKITRVEKSSELFDINPKESLLILHVNSYDGDANEFIKHLLKDSRDLKILVLCNSVDFLEATALLQAGVKGYGNIYMHGVHLKQAADVIVSGNVWIYPELANYLIRNLVKPESIDDKKLEALSEHERECAILAAKGNSNHEIASLLERQEITIKKHLSAVYKKLNIKNRVELALYLK